MTRLVMCFEFQIPEGVIPTARVVREMLGRSRDLGPAEIMAFVDDNADRVVDFLTAEENQGIRR